MKEDSKVLYYVRKYGIENSCLCCKCGNEVLKSPRKFYDYYCPYCQKLLFTDEVNMSNIKKTKKDKQILIKILKDKPIKKTEV